MGRQRQFGFGILGAGAVGLVGLVFPLASNAFQKVTVLSMLTSDRTSHRTEGLILAAPVVLLALFAIAAVVDRRKRSFMFCLLASIASLYPAFTGMFRLQQGASPEFGAFLLLIAAVGGIICSILALMEFGKSTGSQSGS